MVLSIIASVAGVIATFTLRDQPPTPPSASAGAQESIPFLHVRSVLKSYY